MTIKTRKENDEIILEVAGRVDTATTQELQNAIMEAFQESNHVLVDFAEVEYISSAGLRTLLLGHKTAVSKSGSMKLANVGEMVMEVLEMTGFTDVLTII